MQSIIAAYVKKYAAAYSILAVILFFISVSLKLIPEDQRILLLAGTVIVVIFSAIYLHIKDNNNIRSEETKDESNEENKSVYFYKPRADQKYIGDFYKHIRRKIEAASETIYMTGDGFGCDTKESKEVAHSYVDSYKKILMEGVQVVRIQIETKSHHYWADLLGDLLDTNLVRKENSERQDNFDLFILKNELNDAIKISMGTIDHEYEKGNTSFIMFTSEKYIGPEYTQNLASFAMIVEDDREFAREIEKRIRILMDNKYSIQVKERQEVKKVLCED